MSSPWHQYVDGAIRRLMEMDYYADATDVELAEDVIAQGPWTTVTTHDRRLITSRVTAIRAEAEPRTDLARIKVAEIEVAYPLMSSRAKGGRVSKAAMATYVGIDRDTITDWVNRGWMTWPPEGKNPRD